MPRSRSKKAAPRAQAADPVAIGPQTWPGWAAAAGKEVDARAWPGPGFLTEGRTGGGGRLSHYSPGRSRARPGGAPCAQPRARADPLAMGGPRHRRRPLWPRAWPPRDMCIHTLPSSRAQWGARSATQTRRGSLPQNHFPGSQREPCSLPRECASACQFKVACGSAEGRLIIFGCWMWISTST